jgi:serine/threonine protein kinase
MGPQVHAFMRDVGRKRAGFSRGPGRGRYHERGGPRGVAAREFAGNQRFEVLTRLGRGGMGTVYQVIDHARQSRLALKSVGRVTGDALLRFKREFRALQEINHPNIIELGELLEQNGEWFFTMELIAGTELLAYVRPDAEPERRTDVPPEQPAPKVGSRLVDHPVALANVGFDEARLRRTLGQLAEGLHVLHLRGHVHRDIKPSNVLVTHEGRAVIIDFGLVGGPSASLSTEGHVMGTVAYMAPEQAAGQPAEPASDWYAFGALLYESLTGRLPVEGNGLALLMRKQTAVPVRPRELVPGLPEDLEALCMDLLHVDPVQRPRGRAILERLHVDASRVQRVSTTISIAERPDEFVGRREELAFLDSELTRVLAGEQRIVTLLGESGLGKTALLRRFVQQVEAQHAQALVLEGRCYEQETVPYKALDAVMDQLSRWLKRQPEQRSAELLPDDVAQLEHTFPVLSRVPAIARRRRARVDVKDPQQRRFLVMRILRALFDSLARHMPLVVVIDDFQWSDQDSLRMLAHLTGPPSPAPLLLVFASRLDEEPLTPSEGSCLKLGPLTGEESLELALRMTHHYGQPNAQQAEMVARQAEGSPFLIEALLHQIGAAAQAAPQHLDDVIACSVQALDEPARKLVEVVCLAGFPITQQVAAEASGLEPSDLIVRLRALRLSRMVRTSGPLNTDVVEPYHNRIREAVVRSLGAAQRQPIHDALARALEAHHGEPQRIAYHLRSGGEPMRATGYLITAAERALAALAFDRAAAFYAEAQGLEQLPAPERRTLSIARGKALASAGRGRAAAAAFAEAMPGSAAAELLDLKRRVAEQLLNAGYYQEGMAACNAFIEGLGIRVPKGPGRVFVQLLLTNLWLALRGLRSRIREPDQIPAQDVSRIDAYWAMAKGLASYDPIRAQLFHSRGLLTALGAGEPYRLSRAVALSALTSILMSPAGRSRADARLSIARRLADGVSHPHAAAFIGLIQGMMEYIGHCRWRRGVERLAPALQVLRDNCEGVAWDVEWGEAARRLCLYWVGDWKQLVAVAPDACKEAEARGDRHGLVFTRAEWMSFAAALSGDSAGAHREIDDALDPSDPDIAPVERVINTVAHWRVDLCEGAAKQGLARLANYRPGLGERLTLRSTLMRTLYESMVVNVLLAAAAAEKGRPMQRLYARAQSSALRLVRRGIECTVPLSALGLAAVRAARGDDDGALRLLGDAEAAFETEGMKAHGAVARVRRGQLMGGETGRGLVASGESFLRHQGVRDIGGALRILGAGFPADRQGM